MRLLRLIVPPLGALLAAVVPLSAQRVPAKAAPAKAVPAKAGAPPAGPLAPSSTGYMQGVAVDSVHMNPLVHAFILLEGTARGAMTDSLGRFLVDSIPPGSYRVGVDHPILDTLGISLVTQPLTFAANEITRVTVGVPSPERLVSLYCPAARRALGPGALVGRVREPDSDLAAEGARVSLVWYDPDPPGLPANLKLKKTPRVREATVGADGSFRLCGLPTSYEGKLQAQRRDGGATAEVLVSQEDGLLALRSMSVAKLVLAAGADSGARAMPRGTARVLGRVVTRTGAPVANARVGLMGTSAAALTRPNGEFVLDSLPAGTQSIVVRQIGYRPTELAVELSSRTPSRVTVRLGDQVQELSPVEVVSRRDEGLQKVGFLERKRNAATGYFLGPEELEKRKAIRFTDLLRTVPGLRVSQSGAQSDAIVTSTRSSDGKGCVTIFVDGAKWQQLEPGDMDTFVKPDEVAAVESYSGSNMPAQFTTPGQNCSAIVVWTKSRVTRR